MYTYQKIILDNQVFDFVYGCALHDAVLQKAFKGERKWISQVSPAKDTVREYINRVVKGDFKDDDPTIKSAHEKFFLETAQKVCNQINGQKPKNSKIGDFTFGNAQKLINMTVKHIYAHTYSMHLMGFTSIRDHFRYCHCPMDTIMLDNIWKQYRKMFNESNRKNELGDYTFFYQSWGNEDFGHNKNEFPPRYKKFQEAINKIIDEKQGNIFPIEYDYIFW